MSSEKLPEKRGQVDCSPSADEYVQRWEVMDNAQWPTLQSIKTEEFSKKRMERRQFKMSGKKAQASQAQAREAERTDPLMDQVLAALNMHPAVVYRRGNEQRADAEVKKIEEPSTSRLVLDLDEGTFDYSRPPPTIPLKEEEAPARPTSLVNHVWNVTATPFVPMNSQPSTPPQLSPSSIVPIANFHPVQFPLAMSPPHMFGTCIVPFPACHYAPPPPCYFLPQPIQFTERFIPAFHGYTPI